MIARGSQVLLDEVIEDPAQCCPLIPNPRGATRCCLVGLQTVVKDHREELLRVLLLVIRLKEVDTDLLITVNFIPSVAAALFESSSLSMSSANEFLS